MKVTLYFLATFAINLHQVQLVPWVTLEVVSQGWRMHEIELDAIWNWKVKRISVFSYL